MIHITKDYYAKPDGNTGFNLVQKRKEKDKNGNDTYAILGYCGNIEEVVRLAYRHLTGKICAEKEMELKEAIQIMRDTREMICKALGEFE